MKEHDKEVMKPVFYSIFTQLSQILSAYYWENRQLLATLR